MICLAAVFTLSPRYANSQIPVACSDANSLKFMVCCPDNCGHADGRGTCADTEHQPDMTSKDVRFNWPHYYKRLCQCNDNYSGYDCSRCKYGYYGPECSMMQILPRRNILTFSDAEFYDYVETLQTMRFYDSGFLAALEESVPGSTDIETVSLSLYSMFIWLHHFATKDSGCVGKLTNVIRMEIANDIL